MRAKRLLSLAVVCALTSGARAQEEDDKPVAERPGLPTAVFVLPTERGLALVESLAGCACLLVDRRGRRIRTSGWRSVQPENPSDMEH